MGFSLFNNKVEQSVSVQSSGLLETNVGQDVTHSIEKIWTRHIKRGDETFDRYLGQNSQEVETILYKVLKLQPGDSYWNSLTDGLISVKASCFSNENGPKVQMNFYYGYGRDSRELSHNEYSVVIRPDVNQES